MNDVDTPIRDKYLGAHPARLYRDILDPPLRRAMDVAAAAAGLVVLSPLMLVIALLIKLRDGGPALYRAERVGKGGSLFRLYKFRTMIVDAGKRGPGITRAGDPRITPIGRWLRRTKLDELPQLLNVLLGDMSLVGPRPEDPRYVALYTDRQREVLRARPGITGPASLAFRHEEALLSGGDWEAHYNNEVMPAKLALDREYLSHRTVISDVRLVLLTLASLRR